MLTFRSGVPWNTRPIQIEMKILLTADFHASVPWFEWLAGKATSFNLVCVAGDFLDLFGKEPKPHQVSLVQAYLHRIAGKTTVALCSGNHDSFGPIVPAARGPAYPWLVELDNLPNVISDGQSRIVGELIVTTLPHCANADAKRVWLDRGQSIRKSRGWQWLVLHHEPPALIETAEAGEFAAGLLLDEYSPDFWLSGHVHDLPYELGGKWCHKLGTTIVLTPGQVLEASWPNHIELDTESGKIEWRSIRKMGDRISSAVLRITEVRWNGESIRQRNSISWID
jgi:Icc-related predicted phosphoesterase